MEIRGILIYLCEMKIYLLKYNVGHNYKTFLIITFCMTKLAFLSILDTAVSTASMSAVVAVPNRNMLTHPKNRKDYMEADNEIIMPIIIIFLC